MVETLEAKLEIKVPLHPKEIEEVAYALGFLGRPVSQEPLPKPGPVSGPLPWSGPKGVNPRWGYDWTRPDQSWQGQQAKYEQERAIVDELFAWTMQAVEAQKAPSVYALQYQSAIEGLIRLEYFTSGLANSLTSNQVPGGLNRDYGRPFGEDLTAEDYQAVDNFG